MHNIKIILTVILFFIANSSFGQTHFKKYSNQANNFSFDVPVYWTIKYSKKQGGLICIPTTASEKQKYDDCFEGIIFRLEFFNANLDSTLRSGNYTKRGDYYYTTDRRMDTVKAKNLKGKNWTGIYHDNVCGIGCKTNGFHSAGGQCEFIYFSNGNNTILIETNGKELDDKILKRIVKSFSFN